TPAAATAGAASDAPATASAAAGGGSAGGVCDLVTSDELWQALGQDTQTTLVPGPPDTCGIASKDGTPLAAMVLLTSGGEVVFETLQQGSTITDVAGIGDKAFYSSEMQTLTVLKGDQLLTVAFPGAGSGDKQRDSEKAIAAAAAARM